MRTRQAWLLLLLIGFTLAQGRSYNLGDRINVQCADPFRANEWTEGPRCGDQIMEFKYGSDGITHCHLQVDTEEKYSIVQDLIRFDKAWNCRAEMVPDSGLWVPFSIPLWGLIEPTHIHVDNHINFIFHGFRGSIVGVAAYPLKDQFEFASVGSTLHMHGATKWFQRGTFLGFNHSHGVGGDSPVAAIITVALMCSCITLMLTVVVLMGVYDCYLKPALKQQFSKLKQQ